MIKFKRILCPTDLSPAANGALRYAVTLAEAYGAKLYVCYCATGQTPAGAAAAATTTAATAPVGALASVDGAQKSTKALFEATIKRFTDASDLSRLDWESLIIETEDIGETIIREAAERRVELIVMRSRRRPRRAALLGSTAETVCRAAPCPVLVMHPDDREWASVAAGISLKRVLVAYDFSDGAELALRYGLSFAQEYQAELHLLHVLPPYAFDEPEISWSPAGEENAYHRAARRLQKAIPPEAYLWSRVTHAVSQGQPYREILAYAEKHQIDLVSIGAHGAGFGMQALFGSNVDRVLRQAPCPVLVAHPLRPASPSR
jgi:nucleotide-binding universal stress UspA family protein